MTPISFSRHRTIEQIAFTHLNIEEVPQEPGIYTLWFRRRCLYVGQSLNLRGRLTQHWHKSHNEELRLWIDAYRADLHFDYRATDPERLAHEEQRFIRRLHPETNINLVH